MKTKPKKLIRFTPKESQALLSAVYTQIESLKDYPGNKAEARAERKFLRSAEKKLRKACGLVAS